MLKKQKYMHVRLRTLFSVFLILIAVDIIGYMILAKASVIDALYMTLISITTVGYGEVFPLSTATRLFTVFVIITGIGLFLAIAETIIENTLEGRIRKIFGRRKMEKNIYQLTEHVVVAGFGRMGTAVCDRLNELRMSYIIIEKSPERFAAAEERGFLVIHGDATEESILRVAGIEKARYLLSLLSSDSDNILSILTARDLNPAMKIITRAFDATNEKRLYKIGADSVVSFYQLSSARIVSTLLKPNVVDFFDIMIDSPKLALSIEELKISEKSRLLGKTIRQSALREKYNAIVVAVKRGEKILFNPSPDLEFQLADILIVLGERERLPEMA